MNGKREYGDYQTPPDFAVQVCNLLKNERGISPSAIIEPTCGIGGFIRASLVFDAREIYGIELNSEYCEICAETIGDKRVEIINKNFFSFKTKDLIRDDSQVLIIGNPPWVNNSTLSALDSDNVPLKANFKHLSGIDAVTGASNFDICEYIILQLVREYAATNAVIAMLCKTSVARNVFVEMRRIGVGFSTFELFEFDAAKVFGVSASACLMLIRLSGENVYADKCQVYSFDAPSVEKAEFGYINGRLCSNTRSGRAGFDGKSCFEWRQGVKHDCAKVMELNVTGDGLINGENERVNIEDTLVFPLVKSSMFKSPVISDFSKRVIVTQKKPRDDTDRIRVVAPRTWEYLQRYNRLFAQRKSSIYRGAPRYSMFGVGEYSYSRYKVGVSGFYKKPLFCVLYSKDGKPIMTDDTSYFICLPSYDDAYVAMLMLNSDIVREYLLGIAFVNAKRPYTKKVLGRIDFRRVIDALSIEDLTKTERGLGLEGYVTQEMYARFQSLPELSQQALAI